MSRILLIALLALVTGTAVADCSKCDDDYARCTAKCLQEPESKRFKCVRPCEDTYANCKKREGCG